MRICFLVPDGVGLRNYLYSSILDKFPEHAEIVLYTTLSEEIIEEVKKLHPKRNVVYKKMELYRESLMGKLLKEAITYARLRHYTSLDNNDTTMINWTRKKQRGFSRLFFGLAAFTGKLFMKNYNSIVKFEKRYSRVIGSSSYVKAQKEILKSMAPSVIFCTHQRSMDAGAIVEAANQLNIPTIGAVYSWDNLPKARLLVRSHTYVVWSQIMKDEMLKYYPEVPEKDIIITGTPQFEFYFNQKLHLSKEEFCSNIGLDPNKKILCFSGNDLTFPCDELYLKDLAEALMTLPEEERPQVLLRRCPVDLSGRFDAIVAQHPHLIKTSDPIWKSYKGGWDAIVPTPEDVALLVNTSLHADAVINVGSTMAHDFAVFSKPAIYINYDQPEITYWSAVTNNHYQHFRSMPAEDCVIWLNNKEEILNTVKKALNGDLPENIKSGRWFNVIALQPVTEASENIANTIMDKAQAN
ncbi:hypothetical protein [Alkaliflexus imshenetskii]|uniref:hypothetical protein n=1 Tax=Alkaliflexus imshenetskii TaxID=286730 RepID=UPI0004B0AFA1|nr:hypothetical protein [Alkaliflexus imshenetskii]